MKKALLFLLTLSLQPVFVRAQITSLKVSIQPTEHGWQEVVENQGSSSIVALRTTFQQRVEAKDGASHTAVVVVYDSITNYGTVPQIPPSGIGRHFAQDPSQWSGGVDAAIFSDGHSEGDPAGVSDIYERRRGVYMGLITVLPLLDTIANQGANAATVADTIHRLHQLLPNDRAITSGQRKGLEQIYAGAESLLRSQRDIVGLYDPSKYPPQPSINQVAKVNGIPREQAHAIVVMKKYQGLKEFLEANLEPPIAK
jgi:hypothetical protein